MTTFVNRTGPEHARSSSTFSWRGSTARRCRSLCVTAPSRGTIRNIPASITSSCVRWVVCLVQMMTQKPVTGPWILALRAGNHFIAFFDWTWPMDQILCGCVIHIRSPFSENKMASKNGWFRPNPQNFSSVLTNGMLLESGLVTKLIQQCYFLRSWIFYIGPL